MDEEKRGISAASGSIPVSEASEKVGSRTTTTRGGDPFRKMKKRADLLQVARRPTGAGSDEPKTRKNGQSENVRGTSGF